MEVYASYHYNALYHATKSGHNVSQIAVRIKHAVDFTGSHKLLCHFVKYSPTKLQRIERTHLRKISSSSKSNVDFHKSVQCLR